MRAASRKSKSLANDQHGSVAVEMALSMTVIGMMIIGTFEISGLLFEQMQLEKAVQSGAHFALLGQTEANNADEIIRIVEQEVGDTTNLTVDVSNSCSCPGEGQVDCTEDCADNSIPEVNMLVVATKTVGVLTNILPKDQYVLRAKAWVRAR